MHDLTPGVAAGHPATAEAGAEILAEGGSAADSAVAACLASCVAETVMTGLLGGGHAIYFDAPSRQTRNLDCFVAVPGLGADEPRKTKLLELEVPFGAELVHYAVGIASCGVPGVPAGLKALHQAHGRLPWPRLVEPALRLAQDGVEMPPAHAACLEMLAPVMTMREGARIYSPGGTLLKTGDRLAQPDLVPALGMLANEGPESAYTGTLAERLLALMDERGGLVTPQDLRSYRAVWHAPVEVGYARRRVLTRGGLSGIPAALEHVPTLAGLTERDRVLTLTGSLTGEDHTGNTTNLVVVDAEGSACVLTTSLGLGSGDFLPGLDLHLNSMLGETDLLRGSLEPGGRMDSMMAPTLAFANDGLELAIGAAGGTRLRTALVGVTAGILDESLAAAAAVERPRFHPAGTTVHAEPGVDEDALAELERRGNEVRRWPGKHHYFGGVSLIGRTGAAADSRRSGAVRV
jgi:gamma-glutamyltranspeptidase / glutathione hydrolase